MYQMKKQLQILLRNCLIILLLSPDLNGRPSD